MKVTIGSSQDWACWRSAYWNSDENNAMVCESRAILGRGGLAPDDLDEFRVDSLSMGSRQGPCGEWMAIAHSGNCQSAIAGNP
jgi:hypothetical protein